MQILHLTNRMYVQCTLYNFIVVHYYIYHKPLTIFFSIHNFTVKLCVYGFEPSVKCWSGIFELPLQKSKRTKSHHTHTYYMVSSHAYSPLSDPKHLLFILFVHNKCLLFDSRTWSFFCSKVSYPNVNVNRLCSCYKSVAQGKKKQQH